MLNNSVIIVDKPPGLTSHEVTTSVKKIMGASRAGHAGTLDPNVSGVLPVALGKATKLLRYIAGKDKTYVGIIKFRKILGREKIEKLFLQFTGEILQTPPKISAVRKVARKRKVHHLKLLEVQERLALFEAKVDAGTYIRTLCEDMGEKCGGARMEELRRTAVGGITEDEAHSMQEIVDGVWFLENKKDSAMLGRMLRKPEDFIEFPKVFIKESALKSVLSGAQVMVPGVERMEDVEKGERVSIYCCKKFVGVGIAMIPGSENIPASHGIAVKTERIHLSE